MILDNDGPNKHRRTIKSHNTVLNIQIFGRAPRAGENTNNNNNSNYKYRYKKKNETRMPYGQYYPLARPDRTATRWAADDVHRNAPRDLGTATVDTWSDDHGRRVRHTQPDVRHTGSQPYTQQRTTVDG